MKRSGLTYVLVALTAVLVFSTTVLMAQDDAMRKIESARIALITERLDLSPEQAQRFWPIYNEYSTQRKALREQLTQARQGVDPQRLTDEQSRKLMELSMNIRERELNMEREYAQRLLEVISSQQIFALRRAEDDFRRMLLQRIEQRRRQQLNRERMLQRQDERRKRGNN